MIFAQPVALQLDVEVVGAEDINVVPARRQCAFAIAGQQMCGNLPLSAAGETNQTLGMLCQSFLIESGMPFAATQLGVADEMAEAGVAAHVPC